MPKRTTLTYSSEDALADDEQQLHVYYCKYSGRHVLTTTCDLRRAPKRRYEHSKSLVSSVDSTFLILLSFVCHATSWVLLERTGCQERICLLSSHSTYSTPAIHRTDGASVLDTGKYMCKMNTREAGTKIIKRHDGTYEKQYRQNLGKLVVAYRCLFIPYFHVLWT